MKTGLITGASRGFGVLIAQAALDAGDRVIATARNPRSIPLAAHPLSTDFSRACVYCLLGGVQE
ncbi:hypothetical protein [Corallococcus sp. AB045]|uniref:hypothetical protein n=1 Tax=Corallococcus sp. AB045 TaxID=2316719 RepID=UPI002729C962|nr:hypothetical protein [Corallococcus sp. AB045]